MTPEERYELADRAVHHWLLILAGSLSPAQRLAAQYDLIRAVGRRVRARLALEEVEHEVVAA